MAASYNNTFEDGLDDEFNITTSADEVPATPKDLPCIPIDLTKKPVQDEVEKGTILSFF